MDEYYMNRALKEAKKGRGRTSPNPCVGAVIVKNGKPVATGYHKKAGTPHAEIHALQKAGEHARGAILYVTLEPCSHTGKTPPCCRAIVDAGITQVVIGMLDPNPLVNGGGVRYLQDHGVEVAGPVLEKKCFELNRPFIKMITTGLPFVVMKAGLSLDGKLNFQQGMGGAVTGNEVKRKVHRMRDQYDAILVGIETVMVDNPALTTRIPGKKGRDPVRIILDSHLRIDERATVLKQKSAAPTWIFCLDSADPVKVARLRDRGVHIFFVGPGEQGLDLAEVLKRTAERGCLSILVEGGGHIHGSFLKSKLVDRACLFYAPVFAGNNGVSTVIGLTAKDRKGAVSLTGTMIRRIGEDVMITGDIVYR
ncbi:MAG: riboflavin biosynthesis protein RibD [Proteobacteria bacterium]|nr:MAG: riboflavin biosynthesis protein RibD [Pseudomonadota bacterium]